MEIDKAQLTTDVASLVWESMDPIGIKGPFTEQDPMVQFYLKAEILPVITHTLPVVEKAAVKALKDKLIGLINTGHENKMSSDEILLSLSMELS